MTLVPAGIGISYIIDTGRQLELPVKSRYVMLDVDPAYDDPRLDISSLHQLATFSYGRLFENPASVCFSDHP